MAGRRPLCDCLPDNHRGADRHLYRLAEHRHFHSDVHHRYGRICAAGLYDGAVAGAYRSGHYQLDCAVDCRRYRLYVLWVGAGNLHHPHRQTQRHYWAYLLDSADRHPAVRGGAGRDADDGPLRLHYRADGGLVWPDQH
ncbi:hypothetical protein D3C72_1897520 [compost metagenome]